jgi:hypothetical protein
MANDKSDFLDWIMILGALLIIGWALLKAFGILHSPIWVDMIPYFGVGGATLAGAYKLGKIKKGIEETEEKVDKILVIEERFKKLEIEHSLAMNGKLKIKHR